MEIIQRMNKKLDLGWKLTNSNCQKCTGVTLADPNNLSQYYCPKCDKVFEYKQDQEQQIENQNRSAPTSQEPSPYQPSQAHQQQSDEDYFNEVIASSGIFPQKEVSPQTLTSSRPKQTLSQYSYQRRQQRSNEVSKKIGEKLLQGWTMLEQSCSDCNVPLMRSRKGEKLCMSCNKDYAGIEGEKQKKPIINNLPQPSSIIPKKVQTESVNKPYVNTNLRVNNQVGWRCIDKNEKQVSSTKLGLIESIECKALRFLELKMDKAIDQNDIGGVERILHLIEKIKR